MVPSAAGDAVFVCVMAVWLVGGRFNDSLFFLLAALGGEVWRETGCQSEVRLR